MGAGVGWRTSTLLRGVSGSQVKPIASVRATQKDAKFIESIY